MAYFKKHVKNTVLIKWPKTSNGPTTQTILRYKDLSRTLQYPSGPKNAIFGPIFGPKNGISGKMAPGHVATNIKNQLWVGMHKMHICAHNMQKHENDEKCHFLTLKMTKNPIFG
jgi:hypothetical protein